MSGKRRCSAACRPPSRRRSCSRLSVPENGLSWRRPGSTGRALAHPGRRPPFVPSPMRAPWSPLIQHHRLCRGVPTVTRGWTAGHRWRPVNRPPTLMPGTPGTPSGSPSWPPVGGNGSTAAHSHITTFAGTTRSSTVGPDRRRSSTGPSAVRGRRGWIGHGSPSTSSRPATWADRHEPWMKQCGFSRARRLRRAGSSSRSRACGDSTRRYRRTRGCRHIVDGSSNACVRCDLCSTRYGRQFVDQPRALGRRPPSRLPPRSMTRSTRVERRAAAGCNGSSD